MFAPKLIRALDPFSIIPILISSNMSSVVLMLFVHNTLRNLNVLLCSIPAWMIYFNVCSWNFLLNLIPARISLAWHHQGEDWACFPESKFQQERLSLSNTQLSLLLM